MQLFDVIKLCIYVSVVSLVIGAIAGFFATKLNHWIFNG